MTEGTTPPHRTLHGLLGEIAQRDPDRVALREAGLTLTFSDLWTRTGQVASLLVGSGVKVGDVVVAAVPRSIDLMVACFAILRAGASALPIDLHVPPARNRKVIDAASARWSLIRGPELPEGVDRAGAIRLDALRPPGLPLSLPTGVPEDAILVFTSGSTGEPKGVRLSHAALLARAETEYAAYALSAEDVYLVRSSPAFVGLSVVLALLSRGVSLAVADDEAGDKAAELFRLMREFRVTFAGFPPRMLQALLDETDLKSLARLRVVRSAGEALSPELAGRFHAALPACRLVDGYGTTETSGVVLSAEVAGPLAPERDTEAGAPLAGVDLRLVGAEGTPGHDGEIWVSTPMLATGYLGGEPALNSRFVEEPGAGEQPSVRWYRTGDRGRLTPDGRLRVLGRMDLQLNVDGVRAEPAEIEDALRLHESVADAAVWMQSDPSGRSRLVAYLVDRDKPAPTVVLRSFLAAALPPPLIPVRFVRLGALPLTPSGKVDRAALPRPEIVERAAIGPRNDDEARILALFLQVLEVADLGVTDDFFEWGGDSLKAFDLMARIFEATGVKLPGATLLNAPTVEDLAREVAQGVRGEVMTVWLRKSGDLPPLVCLPGLAADPLWMFPLIAALDPRQPLLGLSFVGLKPPITIKGAAARGLEELRAVQPRGPYFLLGHSLGGLLAFEMARDLIASREEVAFLGLLDTFVPGSARPGATPRTPSLVGTLRTWRGRIVPATRKGVRRLLTSLGVLKKRPVELFLPGFRAAVQTHRILPSDLAVTLFRASERSTSSDLASDWAPLARGGVEVIDIPGHHLNLLTGGRANELSVRITEAVARATRSLSAA